MLMLKKKIPTLIFRRCDYFYVMKICGLIYTSLLFLQKISTIIDVDYVKVNPELCINVSSRL